MTLNIPEIRNQFPALSKQAIFLDNPGGTQIVQSSIDQITNYLIESNANQGGSFTTSETTDKVLEDARRAMADLLNAGKAEEIIFGPNMTSITFNISRSLSRTWETGDEILVTNLDHDANITPWVLAAKDRDCTVRKIDFDIQDGILNLSQLKDALNHRPRLLAVGYASNSLGTINPIKEIIRLAHKSGSMVYVDAVQFAPHGPIDVQDLDCDFLVCSAYKFFGPHIGILFGRHEILERLTAYKVRPAPDQPPGKFETGTQNHEGISGLLGTIKYLEWLGSSMGQNFFDRYKNQYQERRLRLKQALNAIQEYEFGLSRAVLEVLEETPGVTIHGLKDIRRLDERVPTFSFSVKNKHPRQIAKQLGDEGIYVWDGNYYALSVTERLGLEEHGGMVRVGPVHYNTVDEIYRFGEALGKISIAR